MVVSHAARVASQNEVVVIVRIAAEQCRRFPYSRSPCFLTSLRPDIATAGALSQLFRFVAVRRETTLQKSLGDKFEPELAGALAERSTELE
jgi:DNA-binding phage protein